MGSERLGWLQRNRFRPNRAQRIGSLAAGMLERLEDPRRGRSGAMADIAAALGGLVDETFCRHCRVAGVDRGRVVIHVDRDDLVFPMRVRWLLPLRDGLSRVYRRGDGVWSIRFASGRDGVPITYQGAICGGDAAGAGDIE
ncbi:MAG: hypothetical protein ACE5E6_11855 [Phycisphaerae bacterium]